jgi:hypothetical protein
MTGDSGVPMTPTHPKKENIQRVDPSVKNPYTPKERKYLAARKIQRKKISSGLTPQLRTTSATLNLCKHHMQGKGIIHRLCMHVINVTLSTGS